MGASRRASSGRQRDTRGVGIVRCAKYVAMMLSRQNGSDPAPNE